MTCSGVSPPVRAAIRRSVRDNIEPCPETSWNCFGLSSRDKGQSRDHVAKAWHAYDAAVAMTNQLDLIADDYLYAAELCRTSPGKLRAGDALHLAVALRHNCQALASLDNDMNVAARHLGLQLTAF